MTPGKWQHISMRDVYFAALACIQKPSGEYEMRGWWIRRDFGCGELLLGDKSDTIVITPDSREKWTPYTL